MNIILLTPTNIEVDWWFRSGMLVGFAIMVLWVVVMILEARTNKKSPPGDEDLK